MPSKTSSHHRIQENDENDQTSSKILFVVRQALLNAAQELVCQHDEDLNQNQSIYTMPFHSSDNNDTQDLNQSYQQSGNAIKKKRKVTRKTKRSVKYNRRK